MLDDTDLRHEAYEFAYDYALDSSSEDPETDADDLYTRIMGEIHWIAQVEGDDEIERLFYSSESLTVAKFAQEYGII